MTKPKIKAKRPVKIKKVNKPNPVSTRKLIKKLSPALKSLANK